MNVDQFVAKYTGKTKGYPSDKDYNGECLSIVKLYIKECFGFDAPPSGSNSAYGYWENFPQPLPQYFEKTVRSAGKVPKHGDILIWNTTVGGGYGHISVFLEGGLSRFTSFEQNWGGRQAHTQEHDYSNVVGWLTPKVLPPPDLEKKYTEEEMTTIRLERDKNWDLYQNCLKETETAKSEAQARKEEYQRFIEDVAKKLVLPASSDRNDILAAVDRLLNEEEARRQLERKLDEEQRKHDQEMNSLLTEVEKLKQALDQQKKENLTLLQRVEAVEQHAQQVQEKKKDISFLEQLLSFFKKGTR